MQHSLPSYHRIRIASPAIAYSSRTMSFVNLPVLRDHATNRRVPGHFSIMLTIPDPAKRHSCLLRPSKGQGRLVLIRASETIAAPTHFFTKFDRPAAKLLAQLRLHCAR